MVGKVSKIEEVNAWRSYRWDSSNELWFRCCAAISYPLGVYHSVPHGIGGGMFAPGIMEFNQFHGITKYSALDYISGGDFVQKTVERFADIGVPKLW